ncbi:MAG: dockerin, partial [Acidobacteria bacterium]|nr:dockerin [Acidobacteriota bacterium]
TRPLLAALALSLALSAGGLGCASDPKGMSEPPFNFAWDWTGIVGTGQSLSVGAVGTPELATTQPYGNLKLGFGGATVAPPFDPTLASLAMVPLTEPIRPRASSYPSAYPVNIYGETPHTAMADQLTAMAMDQAMRDMVSVHTVVGESGQPLTVIQKVPSNLPTDGTSGRAYAATLFEATAINRLAMAAGKSYGIGAIVLTHGESDAGNTAYATGIYQLLTDYNQDLAAITGQTAKIPMLASQQSSVPADTGSVSTSALQVLKANNDHPGEIVCTGPKYQYSYAADSAHVHMGAAQYERVGEKTAQVYFERQVLGHDWQPLKPTSATVSGKVVTVKFLVPVPPLVWDDTLPPPHDTMIPEWKNGRGFELLWASNRKTIEKVEITAPDTVAITSADDLSGGEVVIGYAATAEGVTPPPDQTARWGHLRDSDPFVGSLTNTPNPNYCVAFQIIAN